MSSKLKLSRRDFINGFAMSVAAGSALSPLELMAMAAKGGTDYPPSLTGMRGSHAGSFEVSHALSWGGATWPTPDTLTDDVYDLVVVGGGLSPKHVVNPLRQLCRGIDVFKAHVNSVDLDKRVLTMSAGRHSRLVRVKFNHLVLALGAEIDLRRVPGMPEHALLMQNVGDAMKLHSVVLSRCEEAKDIRVNVETLITEL